MSKKLLATALLPFAVLAQDPSATNNKEVTVVTANRVEQAVSDVLAPVSIITRDDIELTQARSLTDVFRMLPGVDVAVNGGSGQVASIFIRGANSNQALILIDGVAMLTANTGSPDFNQIPMSSIERIEFIRGPRAAVYGSEAIAGVINIITQSSAEPITTLSVGFGSDASYKSSLYSQLNLTDKTKLKVTAAYETTDGYNVHPSPANKGDKHGFESQNYAAMLKHQFSDSLSFFIQPRYYQNIVGYYSFGTNKEAWIENIAFDGGVTYSDETVYSALKLTTTFEDKYDYLVSAANKRYSTSPAVREQKTANWLNQYKFSDTYTAALGLDWKDESYQKPGLGKQEKSNKALFTTMSKNISVITLEGSARIDDNSQFGSHTTWGLAAGWQLNPKWKIIASSGTSFKAPSLYQSFDVNYGNSELKPEESISYDVGLESNLELVTWSVNAYYRDVKDLIDSDPATWKFANLDGHSIMKGAELEASFDLFTIRNQASLEYLDTKDANGNELSRRAKYKAKWQGTITTGNVDWALQYLYQGKRDNSGYDDIILSGYSLWNLSAVYYVIPELKLAAKVENLFDKEYETAAGYPAPERGYYINATYEF
ncbi:TonB-dependent receptor domain-containing protein [Moritella viscosa]|uniref:Vitamin B12 transporter BtuB-Cobalamin receptor-Outer membrane cobalamin translocator n=1 Tax=Moritella viscosa TaxID=80854 RepID=A0A090I8V6_9GAMM|nr:TonB-dependent receptor [Moritella viscosa]CED58315.1 outer membrane associated TonB dependent receptor [Moritella viscosa]SGY94987.1 Vitamin B12 transporter BtuB-Cobalamin receptor-Outer membrane cobalamin translocator [Moritella viscosa]SGZ06621.1 Vitamin B12 transporter BtuB-Cobalamin receptor-Outer membrane cobalamin translocator [Moritella viscosa]SGZ06809.1 Vitamin B12 transporter BtuB-Cobalamin receptor-Outer membrane cobalamin translocator [Moritella viscosa]SHO09449.1 Vitamin B12 t